MSAGLALLAALKRELPRSPTTPSTSSTTLNNDNNSVKKIARFRRLRAEKKETEEKEKKKKKDKRIVIKSKHSKRHPSMVGLFTATDGTTYTNAQEYREYTMRMLRAGGSGSGSGSGRESGSVSGQSPPSKKRSPTTTTTTRRVSIAQRMGSLTASVGNENRLYIKLCREIVSLINSKIRSRKLYIYIFFICLYFFFFRFISR